MKIKKISPWQKELSIWCFHNAIALLQDNRPSAADSPIKRKKIFSVSGDILDHLRVFRNRWFNRWMRMSEILDIVHDMAKGLFEVGGMDAVTLLDVEALCIPKNKKRSSRKISGR